MNPLLEWTVAFSLAALFAASAAHKVRAFREWPGIVRNYRLLPDALVGTVVVILPLAEALTAAALLAFPVRRAGACLAALLLLAYAAALGINLGRGRTRIDCGCFGSRLRQDISSWMVVRNLVLALFALALLIPAEHRPLPAAAMIASITLAATLAFLYPVLAVALRPPPPTYEENYRMLGNRTLR
jgi:hypothetical protein